MAWVIEVTERLKVRNSDKGLDRSYVTSIKRCGTKCSLTTSFDNAKVYTNRKHFQKLLDFFNESGIAYQTIPVNKKG
ncbi:hypothetical protein F0238_21200 [Vibrio coralliilyticus]|uniref:Uncharacterized protein n=1 Tax=Vibrio coralliilyticus TaxID=190893 RepID=A0AAP6ZSS9_9VIBR|nr:hypothetical protein [Vibrio coralliilyticus]NOJ25245.1 hypothetical protein [Vibrio coralliilyticus]